MKATDRVPTSLGDEADILTGFPFKSSNYCEAENGCRLLRGDNIAQGTLRWDGAKYWPADEVGDHEPYHLKGGDVVLAMDRPWIAAGLKYADVREDDLPALLVQRVARLRGKANLDTAFLKYLIGSQEFTQHVLSVQTGTAVPHISKRQIEEFCFLRPSLTDQRAIAEVLGALDDKIDLNRQTNLTLEALAQRLFKSWFVDFDPVKAKLAGRTPAHMDAETAALFPDRLVESELGLIPEGWETRAIGDIVTIKGGSTPSTKNDAFWEGGVHAWATPKDLSGLRDKVLIRTERAITDAGVAKISSGQLPPGTVLMSSRAPVGYLAISQIPVSVNQGFIAMLCDQGVPNTFIVYWLESAMDRIKAHAGGSTFAEISKKQFRPLELVVPTEECLHAFDAQVGQWIAKISQGCIENQQLADLRDRLLPKLISGQLRVRDAERHVAEVV